MTKRIFFLPCIFTICLLMANTLNAQTGKPIRGIVVDNASGETLPAVTIVVLNTNPLKGVTSDTQGNFSIDGLHVGRYDVQATFIGYEPMIIREIVVSAGKETFLTIPLKEEINQLQEVVVRPTINKQEPLNATATASARMLSTEEANRYAGGFDDPARLVSSFAGVAGNVSTNGIAIRGNSPQFLQWRLEGVEIPNPTHFPDITGVGGGILTALSSQVLDNSDFFTGAFPAEYGNALSGVFDMQLRNGNRWDYEHSIQIGTLGIDLSSEGPFKKGSQASYLFNYRYATMALADDLFPGLLGNAAGMRYQDLSFKLNFPTRRAGTFSVWGIGTIDRFGEKMEKDTTKWEYDHDAMEAVFKQKMVAGGVGHRINLGNSAYLKTSLAATFTQNQITGDHLNPKTSVFTPIMDMKGKNLNLVFKSFINKKFSARHMNRTGVTVTRLAYDVDYRMSPSFPKATDPIQTFAQSDGSTYLLSAFSNSTFRLSNVITANIGLHGQYFLLNKNWTVEPRAGIKWQAYPRHSFGFAYGMHSRHEKLDYYFVTTPETGNKPVNKNLDFAKAHHIVFSYDWSVSENMHVKVEPYFQYLYDVPVERDGSFSIINYQDFYLDIPLVNKGKGMNYGIDFTLERYLNRGYYYLITASLFESRYTGGDGVWRDTRLNRNFLLNVLGGKEWMLGKRNQNVLGVNISASLMGGERYTPVDQEASNLAEDVIFIESQAYEKQLSPAVVTNITISYKINKRNTAHQFAAKLINATGYKEFEGQYFNLQKKEVDMFRSSVVMPNISYKFEF